MFLATEPRNVSTGRGPAYQQLVRHIGQGAWAPISQAAALEDGSPAGGLEQGLPEDAGDNTCTLRDAQVAFEPSIYVAVLVAAFGGVKIELGPGRHAKVHPIFLFLCCVPLIIVQLSAIIALRTDMSLEEPFHDPDSETGRQLLRLKIVMVIIVYVMNFKMLLDSARLMLFVLNPMTAVEAHLPSFRQWVGPHNANMWWSRWCFSWPSLAPWPFFALLMNMFFANSVCSDSMSVILDSDTVTDTVFNSLAITFIADLGKIWWDFFASILHLSPLADFKFKLLPSDKVWHSKGELKGQLTYQMQRKLVFPEITKLVIYCTKWSWCEKAFGTDRTFLSRGAGARRIETAVSLLLMYLIYKHQLVMLLLAIDTNILPAARDVCTYWRVHHGVGARNMLEYIPTLLLHMVERMLIISAKDQLKLSVETKLQGLCTEPKFARASEFTEAIELKYSHITWTFSIIILAFFVGPSLWCLLHTFMERGVHQHHDGLDDIDEEQEEEIDELEAETSKQQRQLDRLEIRLQQVQECLQERPDTSRSSWCG